MRYEHKAFEVNVEKYEIGKGLEDGVELWTVCHGQADPDQKGKRRYRLSLCGEQERQDVFARGGLYHYGSGWIPSGVR